MRLGGQVFGDCSNPEGWVRALKKLGYSAARVPLKSSASDDEINAHRQAAEAGDVLIAEVGAWSNPLSTDEETRLKALSHCQEQLALADRIGARCCVNISGSRGERWDGPHPDNLTKDTFDLIVESVRTIIDAVKPTRTCYTLETMPWMYPDSADSYLELIKAIDRRQFAVHFDPVNLICSPQRYFRNAALVRDFVAKLGEFIKSCHVKDIILSDKLTTHLDEIRPGLGGLDYGVLLRELDKLGPDLPIMLEHMDAEEDYLQAAEYIRGIAEREGVTIK